jgi:hypothetical protein
MPAVVNGAPGAAHGNGWASAAMRRLLILAAVPATTARDSGFDAAAGVGASIELTEVTGRTYS